MKKIFGTFLVFIILICNIYQPVFAAIYCLPALQSYDLQYFKSTSYLGSSNKRNGYSRTVFQKTSYKIPNLDTDFVPQGLCKTAYNGKLYHLITAYHYPSAHLDKYPNSSKHNSRIYIIDVKNKTLLKTVYLEDTVGKHVGGITEYNSQIFVVSTNCLYIINKSDLFNKTTILKKERKYISNKNLGIDSNLSFCTTSPDGYLWIGSYKQDILDMSSNSCSLKSIAYAFMYNNKTKALSLKGYMNIPTNCQGMCFDYVGNYDSYDDSALLYSNIKAPLLVYFSVNYANHSKIERYRIVDTTYDSNGTFKLTPGGRYSAKTPLMMQGICLSDSKDIYAIFESKSQVYSNGFNNSKKDEGRTTLSKLPGAREENVVLIDI